MNVKLAFDVKKKFKLNKINSAPMVDENGYVNGLINYIKTHA
jgi:hypothetical protein|tara:strand:- start:1854 stop:1979 length:126 start_codon:yes stop_codon:yes gene_type:complete